MFKAASSSILTLKGITATRFRCFGTTGTFQKVAPFIAIMNERLKAIDNEN